MEITELTDAEFQAFKDATSSVYDTYVPQIDPAVYELVCNKSTPARLMQHQMGRQLLPPIL